MKLFSFQKISLFAAWFLCILPAMSDRVSAENEYATAVRADLVSETASIKPGSPFLAGIRFQMEPGWHIYWRNPGDVGLPIKIELKLPQGYQVGQIEWPHPKKIMEEEIVSFAYEGETVLLTKVAPSSSIPEGSMAQLGAKVQWLQCKEICIPGEAELSLDLPVKNSEPEKNSSVLNSFENARETLPIEDAGWKFEAAQKGRKVTLGLVPPVSFSGELTDVYFFPDEQEVIDHAAPQALKKTKNGYELALMRSSISKKSLSKLRGVLVSKGPWETGGSRRALQVDVALH